MNATPTITRARRRPSQQRADDRAARRDELRATAVAARRVDSHRDDGSHTPPHGDPLLPAHRPS